MAAANTDKLKKIAPNTGWQIGGGGVPDAATTTIPLVNVTGIPTDTAIVMTIDRVDSGGNKTPSKMERVIGVISGSNLINCIRGVEGTAQPHAASAVVEIVFVSKLWNDVVDWGQVEHNQDGSHKLESAVLMKQVASPANPASGYNRLFFKNDDKLYKRTSGGLEVEIGGSINAPQGFLINGKIVPSVTSNNLTVAIKTLAGNDPSASDPVYVRIGDTVRSVTSALSLTLNAGTNWFNAGSAELATKEIDYFVYLGYDAGSGVIIGISRVIDQIYGGGTMFASTPTSEKHFANNVSTGLSGVVVEVIGRFAATLSAGAGYTWSVPTFTAVNLIQRPIYTTRWLSCATVWSGFSVNPSGYVMQYKIEDHILNFQYISATGGTSNSTSLSLTLPFSSLRNNAHLSPCFVQDNGANQSVLGHIKTQTDNVLAVRKSWFDGAFTSSGGKDFFPPLLRIEI